MSGEPPGTSGPYDETIFSDPSLLDGRLITLHAERPVLETRLVQGRVAVITRRAVVERRIVEIDLLHEELHVEYRPGDGSEVFETPSDALRVALRSEEFEIVKRVRVVEEVTIGKRSVSERQERTVTLRREELEAEEPHRA